MLANSITLEDSCRSIVVIFSETSLGLIALLTLCLLLPGATAAPIPIEQTTSSRQSISSYTNADINSQQLLEVLRDSYGVWGNHRSVPEVGNNYSLIVFAVNNTGSYRYVPEDNLLLVHNLAVNKETIRPHIEQSYPCTASVVLVVVWNETKMDNPYFCSAEAGCLVQNVYLAAVSRNLGTRCVSRIDSSGLQNDLGLPQTLIPLLVMPFGYPTNPYPPASPKYDWMTGNLPLVQYSNIPFEDALMNMVFSQTWSAENLSSQELSQLLWAGYGYTNVTYYSSYHRTTPSAWGYYPLVIYVSNATGTYRYIAENHSVMGIQLGDIRFDIANAIGGQVWAANAPAIFLVAYDSSYNGGNTGDGSVLPNELPHEFIEVDSGCVVQQLLLEASAWNLSANIVSNGLEEWNGTGAASLRNILNLSSSLIPLYIVPVGHKSGYNLNLRVKDWDLMDSIQGAYVYKDSEPPQISDENGWANWTGVTGSIEIKVKWLESWVNGSFTVQMDGNKTIEIRCNIFDVEVTCLEQHEAFLQNANVTAFAGNTKITSRTADNHGRVLIPNVPNSTITFKVYDAMNNVLANTNRTITSEEQHETIFCDRNYITAIANWRIKEVLISSSLLVSILLPVVFLSVSCKRTRSKPHENDQHRH